GGGRGRARGGGPLRSGSYEAPEARRQAAIAVDLGGSALRAPAEALRRDGRGRLDAVDALTAVEGQGSRAAIEQILQREGHLLVQRVLDLRAHHAGQARDQLAARRRCGDALEKPLAAGAVQAEEARGLLGGELRQAACDRRPVQRRRLAAGPPGPGRAGPWPP